MRIVVITLSPEQVQVGSARERAGTVRRVSVLGRFRSATLITMFAATLPSAAAQR
jgi:hypothetical protein